MEGTFFALLPTLIAVLFALITKEVFISLFIGIFTGAMLIVGGNPIEALRELFETMASVMGADMTVSGGKATIESLGNAGVIIFMAELGILVALMNGSGGTAAFGRAITNKIKSRRNALLITAALGCTIFMDDYFNRLAVGTIMKPVADKHGISRVRLAMLIGGVSVSVCILIPISSWASAITGNIGEGLTEGDPFRIYLQTLLCNFYPVLMLLFLFISSALDLRLGGEIKRGSASEPVQANDKGRSIDLILPIAMLILLGICSIALPYPSATSLVLCGAMTILLCFLLYVPRKVMTTKQFAACFGKGLKSISEILIILVFAWTLTGICGKLGVGDFVHKLTVGMGELKTLLPALLFLAAMGVAFSTGTAWGTFGMLVPIAVPMFEVGSSLQILSVAAVLSGSVFGNQVSPISDSTLLASNVCECDHSELIRAQLPTALAISFVAFSGFLISGVTNKIWTGWVVSLALFGVFVTVLAVTQRRKRSFRSAVKADKSR